MREDLAAGFGDGADALAPFARQRAAVGRLLDIAPGALTGVRDDLRRTDPVLAHATAFARATARFTGVAPSALHGVTDLLRNGRRPVGDLRAVLRDADGAVPPTLRAADRLRPQLPRLENTLSLLRAPSRVLGAYDCDLRGMFRNWRSFLGYAPPGREGPLGPETVLRALAGDTAPQPDSVRTPRQAYPAPCTAAGATGDPR